MVGGIDSPQTEPAAELSAGGIDQECRRGRTQERNSLFLVICQVIYKGKGMNGMILLIYTLYSGGNFRVRGQKFQGAGLS